MSNTTSIIGENWNFGFGQIPSNATINGISVTFTRLMASGITAANTASIQLCKGATTLVGTAKGPGPAWTTTATDETWGGPTDLWGTTWTPTDLNSVGLSLVVSATNTTAFAQNVSTNNWRMTISWTAGAPLVPTVSSVSPASGSTGGGTACTITGTNFIAGATVTFAGNAATSVVVVSSTSITCVSPAHAAGAVTVAVTTSAGSGSLTNGFTYGSVGPLPAPTLSAVSPSSGSTVGGDVVQIFGNNFYSNATVKFNGVLANAVVSASNIILAQTPSSIPGPATVTVTNIDGQSASSSSLFFYITPLALNSISPNFGSPFVSSTLTLSGQGFLSGMTVSFGGAPADSVQVINSTTAIVTTPTFSVNPGTVDVVASNTNGQSSTLSGGFNFLSAATVTGVVPSTGPIAGGITIVINGSGFLPGTSAPLFNGVPLSSYVYISSTQLQGVTPPGAVGYATITINSPGFPVLTNSSTFQYQNGVYRTDRWYHAANGPALIGAQVYVCNQPATPGQPPSNLATIYSDPQGVSAIQQPLMTNANGHVFWYQPGRELGPAVPSNFVTLYTYVNGKLYRTEPDVFVGQSYQ